MKLFVWMDKGLLTYGQWSFKWVFLTLSRALSLSLSLSLFSLPLSSSLSLSLSLFLSSLSLSLSLFLSSLYLALLWMMQVKVTPANYARTHTHVDAFLWSPLNLTGGVFVLSLCATVYCHVHLLSVKVLSREESAFFFSRFEILQIIFLWPKKSAVFCLTVCHCG